MTRTQFYKIIFLVCFWFLSSLFNIFYEAVNQGFKSTFEGIPYDFSSVLFFGLLVSISSASAVAIFEVLYFTPLLRKKPFGYTLVIKTLFYLSCIVVFQTIAIILIFSNYMELSIFHEKLWEFYISEFVLSGRLLMSIVFWGISISMALFILQVSDKFGQGILFDFLLGKYHRPKEETGIFMFMDLKSSTAAAEKLGHIKYSQLIQDCFFDVTEVVRKHEAKIYQYVGDEVVLFWEIEKGFKDNNCIRLLFSFDELLNSKGDYFKNKYGMIPEFKAAVNSGVVTIAEVGELKKELAYHGDVLNTAARIQEKCNEYRARLLISENVKNQLAHDPLINFTLINKGIILKGKAAPVSIFAVDIEKKAASM